MMAIIGGKFKISTKLLLLKMLHCSNAGGSCRKANNSGTVKVYSFYSIFALFFTVLTLGKGNIRMSRICLI